MQFDQLKRREFITLLGVAAFASFPAMDAPRRGCRVPRWLLVIRAPPQPAASGGVLSSPGLFGVPRSAKYAGLPPLDHPARGHSPDEIRRLAARAASPRCRSSSGNSLCGQNSVGFRESARPFKGIICDDISEIAVGTLITERPPHRTVQAQFGHTAPTLGV
jgi:hypothetical protein